MPRMTTQDAVFPVVDAFAASAAAFRLNDRNYLKFDGVSPLPDGSTRLSNRKIMVQALRGEIPITPADREYASNMIRWFKRITFAILADQYVSYFDRGIANLLDKEFTSNWLDMGLIASLPAVFERGMAQRSATERMDFARGGVIGSVGDRLEVVVEVLRSVYSQQWGCRFIWGITLQDQVVKWSTNQEIKEGVTLTVRGTVKNHENGQTKLGRVKIVSVVDAKEMAA